MYKMSGIADAVSEKRAAITCDYYLTMVEGMDKCFKKIFEYTNSHKLGF